MALENGFKRVEKTEHIMYENAGDLTVKLDNVRWMNDGDLRQPTSFVSMCL